MKRFLRKSWHGIPIGIIATAFLGVAVVASGAYLIVTQTITQQITKPGTPPLPNYGEIIAPSIALTSLETGQSFTKTVVDGVKVELGPDGAGKALRLVCTPDSKYTSFGVTITLTSRPEGSTVGLYGYGITGGGQVSVDLDVAGTYIFDQTITGVAGPTLGLATSTITLTLEDSTTPSH